MKANKKFENGKLNREGDCSESTEKITFFRFSSFLPLYSLFLVHQFNYSFQIDGEYRGRSLDSHAKQTR